MAEQSVNNTVRSVHQGKPIGAVPPKPQSTAIKKQPKTKTKRK